MLNLRAATKGILARVQERTGKSIQFMRDEQLKVLATLQMARNGAGFHVLRYSPSNEPLDYLIVYQAGYVLRLFENEPSERFDFAPKPDAGKEVAALVAPTLSMSPADREVLPKFSDAVAQWALMTLRSLPIGLRIDRWIADEYPELKELQRDSIAVQQQQNMGVVAFKMAKLTVPTTLLALPAAHALFADLLDADASFAVPFEATGLLSLGKELMRVWDEVPADAAHDRELVDRWAHALGMTGWYDWIPYRP